MSEPVKEGDVLEVSITNKKTNKSKSQKIEVLPKNSEYPKLNSAKSGDTKVTGTVPKNAKISVDINQKTAKIGSVIIEDGKITIKAQDKTFVENDVITVTAKENYLKSSSSKIIVGAKGEKETIITRPGDDKIVMNLPKFTKEDDKITIRLNSKILGSKSVTFEDIKNSKAKINIAKNLEKNEVLEIFITSRIGEIIFSEKVRIN